MKKIFSRLRALLRFAPRPDPLELIVRAFEADPFRRAENNELREPSHDKANDSK
jgi:hypothetical protein